MDAQDNKNLMSYYKNIYNLIILYNNWLNHKISTYGHVIPCSNNN